MFSLRRGMLVLELYEQCNLLVPCVGFEEGAAQHRLRPLAPPVSLTSTSWTVRWTTRCSLIEANRLRGLYERAVSDLNGF